MLVKTLQEFKIRVLWSQFIQKHGIHSVMCFFVPVSDVANRSEFTLDCSLQFRLFITTGYCYLFICLCGKKDMFLSCADTLCDYLHLEPIITICTWPLSTYSVDSLIFWIKLFIAWEFSLSHLLVPFSQVHLPLDW